MRLIIVSGVSGSGKSVALHRLEDLGYYCIDNIPAGLLRNFVADKVIAKDPDYELVAVGIDARARPDEIAAIPELARSTRAEGVECEVIFLTAEDDILLKRYSETRRRHPLSSRGLGLRQAIEKERELLAPVAEAADLVLDTTRTSLHELRELISRRVHREETSALSLAFISFGFKHGIPGDADYLFDVRCVPNPFWDPHLRSLTGRDSEVIDYLEKQESVRRMVGDLTGFLETWIPAFESSGRSYLTVALGCTGGNHRSVYFAETLARHFETLYKDVSVRHVELS